MKFRTSVMAAFVVLAAGLATSQAEVKYWDINGTADGATSPPGFADGTWDAVATNWNTDSDGGADGALSAWTAATDDAVFSAGTDVATDISIGGAFVTITGTQTAASILIEEGYVAFRGGRAEHGTGTITINSGATLDLDAQARIGQTGGKVVLNNGTLWGSHPGSIGSSIIGTGAGPVGLEIGAAGTGIIGYDDTDGTPDNRVMTFAGVITGAGGTTTNGGFGTLIKRGPDQIGIGSSTQGGQHNQALFTFAKLRVEQGAYRLRNQTFDGTVKETAFGAVPLAPLADAITLDGGGIGTNTSVTLHANRGITVGPNGGYLDHGAGASLTIPGSISGAGTLTIGSPTSTATGNPGFTLSNTNNENTFTGKLNVLRGTLIAASATALGANPGSFVADSITIGGASPAAGGTSQINFQASSTLGANRGITLAGTTEGRINIPTGGNTLTYDGVIAGPGKFVKMGDGALTTAGAHTYTGGTDVYGILRVNNTSGSGTGTGAVNVKTGSALGTNGTLAGTGSVDGLVTVESAGAIAPGATVGGIGTLTLDGGLTLNTGSILTINLGAPTTGDLINVGGTTTINGGTVNVTDAGGLATGIYPILDYAGALGGSFGNLALGTTPAGFTINLVDSGSAINLDVAATVAGLTGDYNDDDVVDAADFVMWQKLNESNPGGLSLANDLTPGIDASDYTQWSTNFGESGPGSGGNNSAVPEPATLAMLLVGVAAVAAGRRGR